MTCREIEYDFVSTAGGENDDVFILYESNDKTERIVLYRSIEQQIEYILMSTSFVSVCEVHNPTGSNILFMNQYHMILRHKRCIQLYLINKDNINYSIVFLV